MVSASAWVRLHWPAGALRFSCNADHRFTPDQSPFPVLYLARDERTAVLENFADRIYQNDRVDIPSVEWNRKLFSTIAVPPLRVADLYSPSGLEAAQVDTSALEHNDLAVPQAWARSVMTHADGFHGLVYGSRFTRQKCLALFSIPGAPEPSVVGVGRLFRVSVAASHILETYQVAIT